MKKLALLLIALMVMLTGCSKSPARISGVITWMTQGAGGKALAGVAVNVLERNADSNPVKYNKVAYGVTDSNGHYEIMNIPPGTYSVTAYQWVRNPDLSIVEMSWLFPSVKIEPGGVGTINMNYDNHCPPLPPELR